MLRWGMKKLSDVGLRKVFLERKAPPTFDVAIEIHDPKTWIIHDNIQQSVDLLLQGQRLPTQKRILLENSNSFIDCKIVYTQKDSDTVHRKLQPPGNR